MNGDNDHHEHNGHNGNGPGNGWTNGHHPIVKAGDNVIHIRTLADRDRARRARQAAEQARNSAGAMGERLINLPPVTKIMILAVVGVHLGLWGAALLGFDGLRDMLVSKMGFVPARFTGALAFGFLTPLTPLSYTLLHGDLLHLGLNGVMLAALGSGAEKGLGARRFTLLAILCAIGGAALHMLVYPFGVVPVIGASGAISGIFAAVLILLARQGAPGAGGPPSGLRRILPFAAAWIVISLVMGVFGGEGVAWTAHIGGFLSGFAVLRYYRLL